MDELVGIAHPPFRQALRQAQGRVLQSSWFLYFRQLLAWWQCDASGLQLDTAKTLIESKSPPFVVPQEGFEPSRLEGTRV